jgi:hypothetical protein
MQLRTILNRVEKYKSFVYGDVRWIYVSDGPLAIEVDITPRAGTQAICSGQRGATSVSRRRPSGQRAREDAFARWRCARWLSYPR